jgi:hypothetical protein
MTERLEAMTGETEEALAGETEKGLTRLRVGWQAAVGRR